jgi:hypothetical protein
VAFAYFSACIGGQVLFRVQCAAGERAVGGGAGVGPSGTASELEQSFPIGDDGMPLADGDTPTGWESFIKNTSAAAATEPRTPCARSRSASPPAITLIALPSTLHGVSSFAARPARCHRSSQVVCIVAASETPFRLGSRCVRGRSE